MKQIAKNIIGILNKVSLFISIPKLTIRGNTFYLAAINMNKNNAINFSKTKIEKTSISIHGSANILFAIDSLISKSTIDIKGVGNKIFLENGVKIYGTTIQLRGNNCSIKIGTNTSFGGIRIVNVGKNNNVIIGSDCLFSDNIELWASDTHSIFDETGKFINPEQPITIGNKVWVGSHVKILKGVTIQDGSIIGMNSTVTKNIKSKTINVGTPCICTKENVSWTLNYENE
jgi:acetyltransferase-like isoleucine patch superfamily enzyme